MEIYVSYRQDNIPWHWLFVGPDDGPIVKTACGTYVGTSGSWMVGRENYHAVHLGCPECRRILEWCRLNKAVTQEDLYRGCVG